MTICRKKYAYYKGDTISYKILLYIGHRKLFPGHMETDRKITREMKYHKRRKFLLFGSHNWCKRFYYKKRD
jgi:hypothetical protein